ncbi:MAG: hypothetical protein A2W35_18085 [Chloroflexi bacterium RBG_16_57_11]|nr:MAG: hypothetical protein A2W35_18085 [Chloroflexi bacterium RBG_16_57_11]
MTANFLLYGANGFVGQAIARLSVQQGLRPVLAGRNSGQVGALAADLGLEYRIFSLDDPPAIDRALRDMSLVLHCAGPFIYTFKAMADACLRLGVHYLDLTGEIPVYTALAARDAEAQERQVMLMPGVGFDVVPTDCLAAHLKLRLPAATHLTLAFQTSGPTRLPPGTARTMLGTLPNATKVRRDGRLQDAQKEAKTRWFDFGRGPRQAVLLSWGDVFTAYYTTGIPNIEDYIALPPVLIRLRRAADRLRPALKLPLVRKLIAPLIPTGSTPEQRARTRTHVWGEVTDDQGGIAVSRLHGPEAGVDWTSLAALGVVKKVLDGQFQPGFQTPARVFGADFVLEGEGVVREDLDEPA